MPLPIFVSRRRMGLITLTSFERVLPNPGDGWQDGRNGRSRGARAILVDKRVEGGIAKWDDA